MILLMEYVKTFSHFVIFLSSESIFDIISHMLRCTLARYLVVGELNI